MPKLGVCVWFALCENPATMTEPHPILGDVPICNRCKKKIDKINENPEATAVKGIDGVLE